MKKCIKCEIEHDRKTKLCNNCYCSQPTQIEKRRQRDRVFYAKLSKKWKKERSSIVCKNCGKTFAGNRSDQKFCSIDCRNRVITKVARSVITCIVCESVFIQKRRDSKACSPYCIRKWEYKKRNKHKKRFYEQTRNGRRRCNGGIFTFIEWEKMKKEYKYTCPKCKKSEPEIKLTIDHIIPVSKCGMHKEENIQPLCIRCNASKNNHLIKKYERSD